MAFEVRLSDAAKSDIAEALSFIKTNSAIQARRWFDGVFGRIESLSEMPARHALIYESSELQRPLRSISFFSHRIIYEIDEVMQIVSIVRVYHSARAPLTSEDVS